MESFDLVFRRNARREFREENPCVEAELSEATFGPVLAPYTRDSTKWFTQIGSGWSPLGLTSSRTNRVKINTTPRGFNIIELFIVVMIIAVVSGIAIPGILGGIQRAGVDGASRRLADDIRLAQSNALTRGAQARLIAFDQSGAAPNSGYSTDTSKANMYRIEVRSGPSASWPAEGDSPATNSNVLTPWNDLGKNFGGVRVTTADTVAFNSQGFPNSASAINLVLTGPGGTRTVQTSVIGKATIQ